MFISCGTPPFSYYLDGVENADSVFCCLGFAHAASLSLVGMCHSIPAIGAGKAADFASPRDIGWRSFACRTPQFQFYVAGQRSPDKRRRLTPRSRWSIGCCISRGLYRVITHVCNIAYLSNISHMCIICYADLITRWLRGENLSSIEISRTLCAAQCLTGRIAWIEEKTGQRRYSWKPPANWCSKRATRT